MAQNDMYAVMYKTPCYLYGCMKRGAEPDDSRFSRAALGIPERYWSDIMLELHAKHYIRGAAVGPRGQSDSAIVMNRPRVTMEGVEFMQENAMMAKVRKFLVDTKSALPIPWL